MSYTYSSRFFKGKKTVDELPWSNEKYLKEGGIEDALKKLEENNVCFYQNNAWYCSICKQQIIVYWQGWGWKLVLSPTKHQQVCPKFNQLLGKMGDNLPLKVPQMDWNALSKIQTADLTPQQHQELIHNVVKHIYLAGLESGGVIKRKGNPKDDYIWHV